MSTQNITQLNIKTNQTYSLGLLVKFGPHLAKKLAGLAEGGVGVRDLDFRSLLGAEQNIRRGSSLGLGLLSLGSLGIGLDSFRGHFI